MKKKQYSIKRIRKARFTRQRLRDCHVRALALPRNDSLTYIINSLGRVDTITTKLLTLVLFITVIPLIVVGNFSTSIINQSNFIDLGNKNIQLISIISVISLVVAITIAALFARTITTPVLNLVAAAKSIASGDLDQRVTIKSKDEIGQLSTAFNKMAENLQRQEQLKDNFIATLTHDLKVPILAENQTISYLLKETYGPVNDTQREVLELIKSTNNSSLEMVNTLLDVYRYDSGNVRLFRTEFDIVKLAKSSIEEIKSLAQSKEINIALEYSNDKILIKADEREIKRVFHNLISNAINNGVQAGNILCDIKLISKNPLIYLPKSGMNKYTTLDKQLSVANSVLISIKDNGVGISQEDMSELFKRFSLNKGRKPAGTGLGLYYCYQVITKHDGYIWAESSQDTGSIFKFTLPV